MNKAIYIRNLFIFLVFVAMIFATPFVFAQVSSPSLIRLTNTQMSLHSFDNIERVNYSVPSNSIIQLPDEVSQEAVYSNGQLNLRETLRNWLRLAEQNRTLPPRMGPNGRYLFPVRVINNPLTTTNLNPRESIGYLDLIALSQNPNRYSTVRMNLQEEVDADADKNPSPIINNESSTGSQFYNEDVYGSSIVVEETTQSETNETTTSDGDQEVTTVSPPTTSPRPVARPFAAQPEDLDGRQNFRCNNSWDGSRYASTNCLSRTYDDFRDHVQHVLSDLEAINQLRAPRVPVDPRFSICIAYKESGLSPNAVNNDSGGGAWGMYQVRNSTGREALAAYGSVVEGFQQYDSGSDYMNFRAAMLNSTLAQADLHHSVILKKAEYAGLLQRMGNGSMTFNNYHTLAERYYGGAGRTTYANKVINCMRGMAELVSEYGQIAPNVTGDQLRSVLQRVR